MQYKTMVLEFIKEYYPALHEQLRSSRRLLRTVNAYAAELRRKHYAWMNSLRTTDLVSHAGQIPGTALELALEDLQASLRQEFGSEENEPLPIDQAVAFITRHTLPA